MVWTLLKKSDKKLTDHTTFDITIVMTCKVAIIRSASTGSLACNADNHRN